MKAEGLTLWTNFRRLFMLYSPFIYSAQQPGCWLMRCHSKKGNTLMWWIEGWYSSLWKVSNHCIWCDWLTWPYTLLLFPCHSSFQHWQISSHNLQQLNFRTDIQLLNWHIEVCRASSFLAVEGWLKVVLNLYFFFNALL